MNIATGHTVLLQVIMALFAIGSMWLIWKSSIIFRFSNPSRLSRDNWLLYHLTRVPELYYVVSENNEDIKNLLEKTWSALHKEIHHIHRFDVDVTNTDNTRSRYEYKYHPEEKELFLSDISNSQNVISLFPKVPAKINVCLIASIVERPSSKFIIRIEFQRRKPEYKSLYYFSASLEPYMG